MRVMINQEEAQNLLDLIKPGHCLCTSGEVTAGFLNYLELNACHCFPFEDDDEDYHGNVTIALKFIAKGLSDNQYFDEVWDKELQEGYNRLNFHDFLHLKEHVTNILNGNFLCRPRCPRANIPALDINFGKISFEDIVQSATERAGQEILAQNYGTLTEQILVYYCLFNFSNFNNLESHMIFNDFIDNECIDIVAHKIRQVFPREFLLWRQQTLLALAKKIEAGKTSEPEILGFICDNFLSENHWKFLAKTYGAFPKSKDYKDAKELLAKAHQYPKKEHDVLTSLEKAFKT